MGSVTLGQTAAPKDIFFLTADAFGVLPPVSLLSTTQAMYHFMSGYTAKVAGTEEGVKEPNAVFSACFGEAFLPLHPAQYAEQLRERLAGRSINVWLVNTGWFAGPYGVVRRFPFVSPRRPVTFFSRAIRQKWREPRGAVWTPMPCVLLCSA